MSRAVTYSDSDSAGLAIDPVDPADPADSANSVSLALLTNAALHSLDIGSSAHLLLVYLFYSPVSLFLDDTVLAFLAFYSFLCPAVLRILHMPVEMQERLQILM